MTLRLSSNAIQLEHLERKFNCALSDAWDDSRGYDILNTPEEFTETSGQTSQGAAGDELEHAFQGSEAMEVALVAPEVAIF